MAVIASSFVKDLMTEDRIRIFTDVTITPKTTLGVKRYFSSIARNLPTKWRFCKEKSYDDNDSFRILIDVVCLETPAFVDKRMDKTLSGFIYLGLTDDSIILLKVDLSIDIPKEERLEIIGYVLHNFHEAVLKPNKHYHNFEHSFEFGGPSDENWFKSDLRDERSIKLFSKADQKTYFLVRSEKAKHLHKQISYSPPNNISLSLSLMKKSMSRAHAKLKQLLSAGGKVLNIDNDQKPLLFDYLEEIQTSVIFSYIAIEGFANAVIPENFQHDRINERGIKETWNKQNIERWMSTSEKVGVILPKIINSGDIKIQPFWSDFKGLEVLRNDIVHQKTIDRGTKLDPGIYAQMLGDKIFQTISSSIKVIDFFYKVDNAHPYFPLGLGIAKFQVHEIESMEKHFRHVNDDEL
ncbi:MAG: hypothetical protein KF803_02810 [Cyclobacteriaceae bacterium]|nr:hypothetical protein [Cyclobacteriaceae bacterium]